MHLLCALSPKLFSASKMRPTDGALFNSHGPLGGGSLPPPPHAMGGGQVSKSAGLVSYSPWLCTYRVPGPIDHQKNKRPPAAGLTSSVPLPVPPPSYPLPWHSWPWPQLLPQQMPGPHPPQPFGQSFYTESERRSWNRKKNNKTTEREETAGRILEKFPGRNPQPSRAVPG